MTQKELLAKCSERDQKFYDYFGKDFDIKAFTENIEFKVPYIEFVDYHLIANRHNEFFHVMVFEARTRDDAYKFEPGVITDYALVQISELDYYQLTITV